MSGEQQQEPATCPVCKRAFAGFYEVVHHKPDGTTSPKAVRVCSILCLLRWAYNYMVTRGMYGLAQLQSMLANFRGPQGPSTPPGPQGPQGQQP